MHPHQIEMLNSKGEWGPILGTCTPTIDEARAWLKGLGREKNPKYRLNPKMTGLQEKTHGHF